MKTTDRFCFGRIPVAQSDVFSGREISCLLFLVITLTTVGCWSHLGQDSEVSDENEWIAAQVKVALAQEADLNSAPIDVKVNNGVVTLGGFVEEASQQQLAAEAANHVTGVQSVINNIQIK